MRDRVAAHRARRPEHWKTVEAPVALAAALHAHAAPESLIVVDCLTLWLANLLEDDRALRRRMRVQGRGECDGRFHGIPVLRAARPVRGDAVAHLRVPGAGSRHVRDRPPAALRTPFRQRALARARAPEDQLAHAGPPAARRNRLRDRTITGSPGAVTP